MKKILTILLAVSINTFAQQNTEKKEQVKALKVAFITNELSLSSDEAVKFWPIFNTFEQKQQDIRNAKTKNTLKKMTDDELAKLTDKEAMNLLAQLEVSEEELYNNRRRLIQNLKGILTPIKILKLKRAEENFSKKLLQQYRSKD